MIINVLQGLLPNTHLISVDEKTGIQALGRPHPEVGMKKGKKRRIETEYIRNGTICLMAAFELSKSRILYHWTNSTRKEPDFLFFIQQTCQRIPADEKVIFLLDQLNTHKSASLVEWVAKEEHFPGDLGKKESRGILKSMASRKAFLETSSHRIRFVFTPKHCSWLNPIENWFSKIQRQLLKYAEFNSVNQLEESIDQYIQFYNQTLAKPFNWKFKGFYKNRKLNGLKLRS